MRGYVASLDQYVEPNQANRRESARREYRTAGTVYVLEDGAESTVWSTRVWTRDVSVSGAKLSSNEEILASSFYLKLLLPQLSGQFLECEIVRRQEKSRSTINGKEHREFIYGIRFLKLAARDDLPRQLQDLMPAQSDALQSAAY